VNATAQLLLVESKLLSRDLGNLVFGLVFPAVLLLVLGLIPGFTDPNPDLAGARMIDLYTPIVLVLTFAIVGISALGHAIATARTTGVLRRLRLTPVGPLRLLGAQFVSHLVLALAGSALAVLVVVAVHDVAGPQSWIGFLLALAASAASIFAIGVAIGAVAPSPSSVNTISVLVWLPLLVLAGLWFPREAMPDLMRRISDLSPGGAAVDAVQQAWFSGVVHGSSLLVLGVSAVAVGALAVVTFQWE
jgi:ABC-2 type transport system permease protein